MTPGSQDRRRTALLALLVLVVGSAMTAAVARGFDRRTDAEVDIVLAARASEAVEVVQARISRAFDAGIAVRSLLAVHPDATADQFRAFAVDGGLLRAHPRLVAVSFARWAASGQVDELADRLRDRGIALSPEPVGDPVAVVELIAPMAGNEQALGLDLTFEERREDAILRARDRGVNTITAPISLVQDEPDRQSVLLFVPIYSTDDVPSTGPERRRAFLGVATAVARADTLLAGIVGPTPIIDLEVTDVGPVGEAETEPVRLHLLGQPVVEGVSLDTTVGDRRWRLSLAPNDAFPAGDDAGRIARFAGTLMTLAILGLVLTLSTARGRAEALVERRTAELRESNRELLAANMAKSTFLSTVSHELRTPLTAILGFVALLREHREIDEEARRDMLDRVSRNAQNLHVLIEELLAYSRLEDGGPVHRIDLDLAELAGRALDDLSSMLATIELRRDLEPGVRVHADPQGVGRILGNLVTNAAKYGGPGVSVDVEVRADGEHALLVVRDDGRGIPTQDQERVFEQFERGTGHTTVPGTGIGLAVVRGLARRHGGDVTLESTPGHGATFTVRLPRLTSAPPGSGAPVSSEPGPEVS